MYPQFHLHQHECRPSGITLLCIERDAAGSRYAYSQRIEHRSDIAVSGFAVIEKRECHTAGGRIPENGKARNKGR